jgi:signal transduction histidine kinase/ActR/RegA family two-component response regulator
MRQACQLVVNIPELRALIAEQNHELTPENQASLQERLDYINGVVGATFVVALNQAGTPIALNPRSPWDSTDDLKQFLQESAPARSLIQNTFAAPQNEPYGLWVYRGRLYHVAAAPVVFQGESETDLADPEGALMMGKRLTDELACELGQSYGCEITFLAEGAVAMSSLPANARQQLLAACGRNSAFPGVLQLGEATYRAASEPLLDPCSGETVGTAVIQQNQAYAQAFLWKVLRNQVLTMLGGVAMAAAASFLLSLAITRPVQALVGGVRRVAQGDLDVRFQVAGQDELAQLAGAFDDMVGRLRQSRDEMQRLLEEARQSAQREHLLRVIAQQINQRLDVQSSLTMFIQSVGDVLPDMQLAVFRLHPETQVFQLLERDRPQNNGGGAVAAWPTRLPALQDAGVQERLARHELVYLPAWPLPAEDETRTAAATGSACLAPLWAEQRLLGVIAGVRTRPDGFRSDERDFLQALADHFAIALVNAQVHEELCKTYQNLRDNQRQIIQSERLRALGQMASGIAHDFNNHLTGVLAFLEISLDREELDEELRSWLEMSRDSAVAAGEVVKLLRSFYRRDGNDALAPVDLNKLASETISLTRPRWFDMARRNGLAVEVREELANVGYALGNAAELRDALTNLLFNAVDAMPQGGVITVRTRRDGNEVILEVEDTGTGMTDEVRERCLEPFYTTKGTHGTGLGLSMVHGIVERNRGRMTIDSQLGRGTTIAVHLVPTEVHSESGAAPDDRGQNRRKRILCVDDDVRVLKSLEGMLRQLGHEVATTTSGADAIDRVKSQDYDVLITDLGMPNIDGREVARTAKRHSPHTGVLLFTGWADRLAIEGDLPDGVDQVLGKPIGKQKLQEAILQVAPAAAGAAI